MRRKRKKNDLKRNKTNKKACTAITEGDTNNHLTHVKGQITLQSLKQTTLQWLVGFVKKKERKKKKNDIMKYVPVLVTVTNAIR